MFTFKFSFEADVLAFFFFWFGDCFGYFIKNLGEFSPNLLVALVVSNLRSLVKAYLCNNYIFTNIK
jgi:hypothetical protein